MENKICSYCKKDLPFSDYNYRDGKPLYNCKKCLTLKRQKRYLENREENIRKVQAWVERNRARSNENKNRWRRKNRELVLKRGKAYYQNNRTKILARLSKYKKEHPESRRESNRLWKLKNRLNKWLNSIDKPINKSTQNRDCEVCGIDTRMAQLYIFDGKYTCAECLKDFKDTSPVIKPEVKKIMCISCGRTSYDTRYPKCIDCRVLEREESKRGWYTPLLIDMSRYPNEEI